MDPAAWTSSRSSPRGFERGGEDDPVHAEQRDGEWADAADAGGRAGQRRDRAPHDGADFVERPLHRAIPGPHAAASARRRASSDPKFLALSRFARASASSRAYRYVPGCLATQRSPDAREAKKKTKLQNVAITLAADVSKSRASGNRNETTAFCGSADSI